MAGYYEAIGLLKQAQVAMRQADEVIEAICRDGEPSEVMGLVDTALQLKACLNAQMLALEAVARNVGPLTHTQRG